MSRKCELTGKMALTGNNVSHANNKTKRRFLPNLNMVSLASEKLEKSFKLKVSASALRTVDKKGGLDLYLLSVDETLLSRNALKIKKLAYPKGHTETVWTTNRLAEIYLAKNDQKKANDLYFLGLKIILKI